MHLSRCKFEETKDLVGRRIGEMVNLAESRQIIISVKNRGDGRSTPPLKNIGQEEGKTVDSDLIILTNFIFPGALN